MADIKTNHTPYQFCAIKFWDANDILQVPIITMQRIGELTITNETSSVSNKGGCEADGYTVVNGSYSVSMTLKVMDGKLQSHIQGGEFSTIDVELNPVVKSGKIGLGSRNNYPAIDVQVSVANKALVENNFFTLVAQSETTLDVRLNTPVSDDSSINVPSSQVYATVTLTDSVTWVDIPNTGIQVKRPTGFGDFNIGDIFTIDAYKQAPNPNASLIEELSYGGTSGAAPFKPLGFSAYSQELPDNSFREYRVYSATLAQAAEALTEGAFTAYTLAGNVNSPPIGVNHPIVIKSYGVPAL